MIIIHHDHKQQRRKKVFLLLCALFILYGLFFSPVSNVLSGAVHTAATPLWKAGQWVENTTSPFLGYFSSRRGLYIENKDLKQQVAVLNAKLSDRSLVREENSELKKMLGRDDQEKRVLGIVLVKPNQTPYDTLILDIGGNRDVAVGDKVFLESVLLGEVTDVYPVSSKVKLYSTPDEKKTVSVGKDAISAEATGLGGGNFEVLLPRDSNVHVGDYVSIPGIQPALLGVVGRIETDSIDAFDRVYFKSEVNPFSLRFVEVVL